jgi:hypothetical protein
MCADDFESFVGASAVDNQNLPRLKQFAQRSTDVWRFVEGNYHWRDFAG